MTTPTTPLGDSMDSMAVGDSMRTVGTFPGAPIEPIGANPMLSGLGPGAYAMRSDKPDLTVEGEPKIVPMSDTPSFFLEPRDPDPRGMTVIGADDEAAGTVVEIWVDRSEPQVRYLELEVTTNPTTNPRRVLLPIGYARVDVRGRRIKVKSIVASQFADVPGLANPRLVTLLEEDRIMAYYAAGYLYATPERRGPSI